MNESEFDKSLCENCSSPLFLSREECRDFIENKLKQGYIVCQCCGAKHAIKLTHKPEK